MPVVICDTGPLNYLILIEAAQFLPRLFAHVLVPAAVRDELDHPKSPSAVRDWVAHPPSWFSTVAHADYLVPEISKLHLGERDMIGLALARPGSVVLMDDRDGVLEALRRGLNGIGTLAFLDRAALRRLIKLPEVFRRLRLTSFRAPLRVMAQSWKKTRNAKARSQRCCRELHTP